MEENDLGLVILSSRAGDALVTITEENKRLCHAAWFKGRFHEQKLLEYIYWHYTGGVFVDVGSCIGNHTLFFAKFCDPACVISVEPVVKSIERQDELFELNAIDDKVITLPFALSYKKGMGAMECFGVIGQHRLRKGNEITITTLDKILRNEKRRITVLKIDVEGHEWQVLQGAKKTLEARRPEGIFLEFLTTEERQECTKYLAQFRYKQVGAMFQDARVWEFRRAG